MISVEHLKVKAGSRSIFQDLNFTVNTGEVLGIIGPSGCGKSLLLRTMINLHPADGGKILFDGEKLLRNSNGSLKDKGKVGMVFQNYNLFDHLTVLENVVSGPIHLTDEKPEDIFKKAGKIIRMAGLGDVAYQYPASLSNGQKQRVAIARTLAMDPEIVLLDEPTSALDPMMKGEAEAVIRMIAAQGKTMILVSNEMELIRGLCNRVIFLNEGVVYEEGTPDEIFEHPKRDATRRFVRQLRVLEYDVESKNFDFIGNNTRVCQFAFANGIPPKLQERLVAILEELYQMVIIQPIEENKMHIAFEFNRKENTIRGDVMFSGPYIDPDDPMFFFSWPIIVKRSSEVEVRKCPEDDPNEFTNDVHIVIRDDK